jgi:hypothetical protein
MNPVRGYTMLQFLEWIVERHPEVTSFDELPTGELMSLADQFEDGKLRGNDVLTHKWKAGFDYLRENDGSWQGYDAARAFYRTQASRSVYKPHSTEDFLRRYRRVPIHAAFLYSSEDRALTSYVNDHWNALDRMSGDLCDIHPSLDQLLDHEDAYELLDETSKLRGLRYIGLTQLPGIIFWDHNGASEYVALRDIQASITVALRTIFENLRRDPDIASIASAKRALLHADEPTKVDTPPRSLHLLFLAANPTSTSRLSLDEEIRSISEKVRLSDGRDNIRITSGWAVRPDDLLQYLNQHKPDIVHFSGHGTTSGELVLVAESGKATPVSPGALEALFTAMKDNVQLVLLNACYSRSQAEAIAKVIDYVIGMRSSIRDDASAIFAASFYRALGFGRTVRESFDQAKVALLLEGIASHEDIPELLIRAGQSGDIALAMPIY